MVEDMVGISLGEELDVHHLIWKLGSGLDEAARRRDKDRPYYLMMTVPCIADQAPRLGAAPWTARE